jgi:hypothetical protein
VPAGALMNTSYIEILQKMTAGEEENVVCHLVSINKMQQQRSSDAKDELRFFFLIRTIQTTFRTSLSNKKNK